MTLDLYSASVLPCACRQSSITIRAGRAQRSAEPHAASDSAQALCAGAEPQSCTGLRAFGHRGKRCPALAGSRRNGPSLSLTVFVTAFPCRGIEPVCGMRRHGPGRGERCWREGRAAPCIDAQSSGDLTEQRLQSPAEKGAGAQRATVGQEESARGVSVWS